MKTRWLLKAWHKFWCWELGHEWKEIEPEFWWDDTWRFCSRCGRAEIVDRPPEHPNCLCTLTRQ
jgi:hypothetical protein